MLFRSSQSVLRTFVWRASIDICTHRTGATVAASTASQSVLRTFVWRASIDICIRQTGATVAAWHPMRPNWFYATSSGALVSTSALARLEPQFRQCRQGVESGMGVGRVGRRIDQKSIRLGKSEDLGGRRIINKKNDQLIYVQSHTDAMHVVSYTSVHGAGVQ